MGERGGRIPMRRQEWFVSMRGQMGRIGKLVVGN